MRFFFSFLICFIALSACENGPGDSPATGLRVSDPDHLYFKNLRINLYTSFDDNELHLTRYTHRKFNDDSSPVRLVLVDNWIHGLAYLELEADTGRVAGTILRIGAADTSETAFDAEQLNNRQALRELKNELAGNATICYPGESAASEYCFLVGSPVREAFRETILDFLKLTQLED